ncbi:MAG: hypothetical protein US52_C0041G0002 [candidate division WS6 bacterium GW2011_GWA2_37_6]|uniref:DUF4342 domain-containing protein n=1 Tax=candidate division WS6 bacterium GW2011_GWA2_37_6 TaxID=1619087 RepID=A0A0G0K2R0_9BACT|nr:MAG: hypothetical protein US52_C0041G0002 [candidate division WS6 bacterium GW2011_GWA2_37_6]
MKENKGQKKKPAETSRIEEFTVTGDQLLKKIKEIIAEGNARSIIIKNYKGREIMEIPVMVTVVGTVLAPYLTAIGAIAAVVSNCRIVVRKK